jgi:transcription-repair coupling factor (superfamily II helicase)
VLVPGPDRFADELRLWLGGRPATQVFAEVAVSFLDRPPAFDEAVNRRLEALTALTNAAAEPVVVVTSRRAITRQTISRKALVDSTVVLRPGQGPDPVAVAGRLVELGYTREPLVEQRGQFSLRGGILDVYPSAADAPVRAEWSGDTVETLRLFDPENQRSVMAIEDAVIRTGRELLIGPSRGASAVSRLRDSVALEGLRGDVLSEWEDELTRLASGAAFAGVEFYAAYIDPARPSLFEHLPEDALVVDMEPRRQLTDARTLLEETAMLAAAEAEGGELPRGFALPVVERFDDFGRHSRLTVTSGEGEAEAVDLGWFAGEPLVGQQRALAGFAARSEGASIVFATEQDERLRALLDEAGVKAPLKEVDLDLDLEIEPAMQHSAVDLAAGFSQPSIGLHVATDAELFGRVRRPSRTARRTKAADLTREFTLDFAPDELVVHVDHGIARFKGMRLIESEGAHREYLELEYAEGDRLFVPVENLDRVQKYLGGEAAPSQPWLRSRPTWSPTGRWTACCAATSASARPSSRCGRRSRRR